MKKINYHIIWIVGLFLLLVVILAMVMTYKIRYEDSIYYKYLYFYNCNNDICSTTNEKLIDDKSDIYSVYKYKDETPTFTKLQSDYIEIKDNNKNVLYDYVRGENITVNYKDYKVINNENILFIASNEDNKYHKEIWIETMENYLKDKEAHWYDVPDNVVGVLVNPITGEIANEEDKKKKLFYFIKGTEPYLNQTKPDLDAVFKEDKKEE